MISEPALINWAVDKMVIFLSDDGQDVLVQVERWGTIKTLALRDEKATMFMQGISHLVDQWRQCKVAQ